MKTNIHPKYYENIKVTCSCGNVFITGSTLPEIKTEICSACHPFYTGQQKLVDTAGRVDKFMEKVKKAQKMQEKKVNKIDEELDEVLEENIETENDNNKKVEKTEKKQAAPKKKAA